MSSRYGGLAMAAAIVVAAAGCDAAFGPNGVVQERTIYRAVSLEFERADTGERVDLVDLGAELELRLLETDETFQSLFRFDNLSVEVDGLYEFGADSLTLSDDPMLSDEALTRRMWEYSSVGHLLVLTNVGAVLDWDRDGGMESVELEIVFEEQ